jgi:Protein of unknown function (DUF3631)
MTLPPPEICRRILALHELLGFQDGKYDKRAELLELLAEHGLSWNDLPDFFVAMNAGTATPLPAPGSKSWEKHCRRICQLHAAMGSPDKDGRSAQEKLVERLGEQQITWWGDLPAILAADWVYKNPVSVNAAAAPTADGPQVNVLELELALLEDYVTTTADNCMIIALWTLASHVFDQFLVSPRLLILSPVKRCGKTTLLKLIETQVANGRFVSDVSGPGLFHDIDANPRSPQLVDEVVPSDFFGNPVLKRVFNDGFRRGATVRRFWEGQSRDFNIYVPVACAAIAHASEIPPEALDRSFPINMQRRSSEEHPRRRFDERDQVFSIVREEIKKWAATCSLSQDPEMPPALRDRAADICRPSLAVADCLGYGDKARAVLVDHFAGRPDEDPAVLILFHGESIFKALETDRIERDVFLAELRKLDYWSGFTGPKGTGSPHDITKGEMLALLRKHYIHTRTVWSPDRSRSHRGFYLSQFEQALKPYRTSEAATSSQPRKIIALAKT